MPSDEAYVELKKVAAVYLKQHTELDGGSVFPLRSTGEEEFSFLAKRSRKASSGSSPVDHTDTAELEIFQYIKDPNATLIGLDAHPSIKKMHKELNTPQTSSADVERLFSIAGMIESGRRSRTASDTLEDLLFLNSERRALRK